MPRRHGTWARETAVAVNHRCASSIYTACIRGCSRAGQQDSGRAAGSRNRMMRRCARSACSRVSAAGARDVYAATATPFYTALAAAAGPALGVSASASGWAWGQAGDQMGRTSTGHWRSYGRSMGSAWPWISAPS
jgi:hypothetical protein